MSAVTSHSAAVSRTRPFYARHAQAYDLLVTDPVEPWVQAVHERLVRAGRPATWILDAGCGTGRHAAALTALGHHVDLAEWFRGHGVRTLSHPVVWEKDPGAAVMVAGNGSAMVYAQPNSPREGRWPLERLRRPESFGAREDLIARLVAEPAVALLAAERGEGGVALLDAAGEASLTREHGLISYQPGSADPLALGAGFRGSAREWLARTWDATLPDAAFQLLDQFRSARTGDLVVVGNQGYDFRRRFELPEHRSGHGSLIRAHMQTPLWSNHPLPPFPLRTIDLFPTMLDWLGTPLPTGIDGELVWRAR